MSTSLVPPELLNPIVAYFQPRRVIVFGSVARGDAGPDSDIDLLVVVDDDTPPEMLTLKAAYEARKSYGSPTDIFPCREGTYRRKCWIVGTLPYAARTEGVVVYERG
jgi:predicted nucleotidyltransferase